MIESKSQVLEAKIKKLNIKGYRKHILFCGGPKCCDEGEGKLVWEKLKTRLASEDPEGTIFRTKVKCLRVCQAGPIAVVNPRGTWYGWVNEQHLDKIINNDLFGDEVVDELRIAENEHCKND